MRIHVERLQEHLHILKRILNDDSEERWNVGRLPKEVSMGAEQITGPNPLS
jgi:hypothetical protein